MRTQAQNRVRAQAPPAHLPVPQRRLSTARGVLAGVILGLLAWALLGFLVWWLV